MEIGKYEAQIPFHKGRWYSDEKREAVGFKRILMRVIMLDVRPASRRGIFESTFSSRRQFPHKAVVPLRCR